MTGLFIFSDLNEVAEFGVLANGTIATGSTNQGRGRPKARQVSSQPVQSHPDNVIDINSTLPDTGSSSRRGKGSRGGHKGTSRITRSAK